jgi:hypothetical protein
MSILEFVLPAVFGISLALTVSGAFWNWIRFDFLSDSNYYTYSELMSMRAKKYIYSALSVLILTTALVLL